MKRLFSTLALAALALASQTAFSAEPSALYTQHCLSCHGANRLGAMGPALLPESLERLKRKDADATIRDGRPATQMPAFGQILTGAEIEALVDWIHTPVSPAPTWSEADIRNSRIEHFPPGSLPDTLYFSTGGQAPVTVATQVAVGGGGFARTVSADMQGGWSYLVAPDVLPGYELVKVTRSDGKTLSVAASAGKGLGGMVWRTDRSWLQDQPGAVYENLVKLVDFHDAPASGETYTFTYAVVDHLPPTVLSVGGLAAGAGYSGSARGRWQRPHHRPGAAVAAPRRRAGRPIRAAGASRQPVRRADRPDRRRPRHPDPVAGHPLRGLVGRQRHWRDPAR